MRRMLMLTASLALCPPAMVSAHDVWVTPDYLIEFGHPAEGPEAYPAERLMSVRLLDHHGQELLYGHSREDGMTRLMPASDPAMALLHYDNGHYTQNLAEGGYERGRQADVAEPGQTRRFVKFGKTLFGWSPIADQPRGLPLEIVPLADPAGLADGDPLPLQVQHAGQPLAGVTVLRDVPGHEAETETGPDGKATIAYNPNMPQLYTVRHEVDGIEADVAGIGLASALYLQAWR